MARCCAGDFFPSQNRSRKNLAVKVRHPERCIKKGSKLSPAALKNAQRFAKTSVSSVQLYCQFGNVLTLEAGNGEFLFTRLPGAIATGDG